jgi:hypothetical protein
MPFSYIKLKAVQMLAHSPTTVVQQFIINVVKLHYKTAPFDFQQPNLCSLDVQ